MEGVASCGKEQPNNIVNLLKYAVHGRGATKPPVPMPPHTASSKSTLVQCLATQLYCNVALIAARAPIEGVTTFDSYQACA